MPKMNEQDLKQYMDMLDKAGRKVMFNTEDLPKHKQLLDDMFMKALLNYTQNEPNN